MRKLRDEQKGVIFIVLIVLIITAVSLFFIFSLQTDEVKDILERDQIVRMLFVVENEDSDALFSNVLIFNPETKKGAVINLPGYTGAIYQSLGRVDKLEIVYNELGIERYKNEIEKLLGIKIPFTSVVKLNDFIRLCDMFGGMRVFIPSPIDCVSEDGDRWLLPSGAINLDGDKVATYLQYRDEEETEDNIQDRYQNVMVALLTGLHDKSFVIFNKNNFKKYAVCFDTNLDDEDDEESLFSVISEIDTESIIRQTITGSLRNVDNQQLLFPLNNGEFIKEAIQQTTNMLISSDGTFTNRVYVLEIQNGTTTQGLAKRTSTLYQDASYNVLAAVNADSNDYAETVIIDHIGNESAAKIVGELIHCTNIQQASTNEENPSSSEAQVDFTIILGRDFNGRYVIQGASY